MDTDVLRQPLGRLGVGEPEERVVRRLVRSDNSLAEMGDVGIYPW